uniref:G_PROTEIN_RECEP_F1_2 domain-containing protein n=1 Tax=Ascaris lumbricoides TaxID=6252 RepID=A0A0M3IBL5_ASCLU
MMAIFIRKLYLFNSVVPIRLAYLFALDYGDICLWYNEGDATCFVREMQSEVGICLKASLIPLIFFILQLFLWGCFSKGWRFSRTAGSAAINPSNADKKAAGNSKDPRSIKGQTEAVIALIL